MSAKHIGSINIKNLNANAEIKGNVVITSRPKLAAAWRIEPNLAAQVNLGDTGLSWRARASTCRRRSSR